MRKASVQFAAALTTLHAAPSLLTVPAVHRLLLPSLAGRSATGHVALTFDDGPDPRSTPAFLDALGELQVRATFFVLGRQLADHADLGRRIAAEGHDVAVHGWTHRPHLLRAPWQVYADLRATRDCVGDLCASPPRFWRPPNGIVTGAGLLAARRLGLRPVLWTADGADWRADATPVRVRTRIEARLQPGGVVLLHDSDVTSAAGSWRAALGALPDLVHGCRTRGWPVGSLSEHF